MNIVISQTDATSGLNCVRKEPCYYCISDKWGQKRTHFVPDRTQKRTLKIGLVYTNSSTQNKML